MKIIKIFFLSMIFFIPLAGIITTPDDLVLKGENRNITAFPEIGKKHFFANLQKYVTDRIFYKIKFTEEFFPIFNRYFSFFKFDSSEITIEGRNGWLFFWDRTNTNVYMQHAFPIDGRQYEKYIKNKEIPFLRKITQLSKAPLYVIVGPDKHGIYPEYMDPHFGRPGQYRLFSNFKPLFEDNGFKLIDVYDAMRNAKGNFQNKSLYYTDDTHWNLAGAKVAFDYFMPFLVDNYRPYDYQLTFSKHANGDLVRNIEQPKTDYLDDVKVTRRDLPIVEVYDFYTDKLISDTTLNFEEPYFGTLIINKNAKDKRTVLLLSDSFGYALKSYLSDYFYKVIHVPGFSKMQEPLEPVIDKANPDIVLLVNVERNLSL
ncbi:MAG: hypothetical protein ACI4NE_04950 [Succinivibrio sp.]